MEVKISALLLRKPVGENGSRPMVKKKKKKSAKKKKKGKFTVEKLEKHTSARGSRSRSTIINHITNKYP